MLFELMQGVQGLLVGKVLTKADVELCRVVLPRMAMEANMPEVVDAHVLHLVGGPSAHHSLHCCQSAYTTVLACCVQLCTGHPSNTLYTISGLRVPTLPP